LTVSDETNSPAFAVIMAGGSGTRFWPYSRRQRPKHLLGIFGEKSLLQQTVARLIPLIPPERILIVTAREHAREVLRQLPELAASNIISEPVGRNTAPCIGLAAEHIRRRAANGIMVCLPADHLITDQESFRRTIAAAIDFARFNASLVTIGIKPTAPETGYGYIQPGEMLQEVLGKKLYRVGAFREKPSPEQAKDFLARGDHLWNSGVFIWQVKVIREELEKCLPNLYRLLEEIGQFLGTRQEAKTLKTNYGNMEPVSIDYGVLERAERVLVIPGEFDWRDLGSWDAFWELSEKDRQKNAVRAGDSILLDTTNSLAVSPGKLVVLLGVEDLLIVETKDTLLICRRGRSQHIGNIPKLLAAQDKTKYL